MTDNVSILPIGNGEQYDPDLFLQKAIGKLDTVLIIGSDKDGDFFFTNTLGKSKDVLWLLELARFNLMEEANE